MRNNKSIKKIGIFIILFIAIIVTIFCVKKDTLTQQDTNSPIKIELKKLNIDEGSNNYYKIDEKKDTKDSKISINWYNQELNDIEIPNEVTIQLRNKTKIVKKVKLNSSNNWSTPIETLLKNLSSTGEYTLEIASNNTELENYTSTYVIDKDQNIEINLRGGIPTEYPHYILISKVWDDNNNEAGKRPTELEFTLYDGETPYETFVLNEENEWSYLAYYPHFSVITNTTDSGFSVVETSQSDYYKTTIEEEYSVTDDGKAADSTFTVTNTFTPIMKNIQFKITKNWEDNNNLANKRPDTVNVGIYGSYKENDAANSKFIAAVVLNSNAAQANNPNSWQLITPIIETEYDYYYIKELGTNSNYTVSISPIEKKDALSIADDQTQPVNNNMGMIAESSLNITKYWEDNSNEKNKRPDEIIITLYHSSEDDESTKSFFGKLKLTEEECTVIEDITGYFSSSYGCSHYSTDNSWTASFSNFRKEWTNYLWIEEKSNQYYNMSYEVEYDFGNSGGTADVYITNTYTELPINSYEVTLTNQFVVPDDKIAIGISKYWDDNDNENEKRPETITLQLLADGTKVKDVELTAFDNWYTIVSDMPKYNNVGNEIVYTLEEETELKFYEKVSTSPFNLETQEDTDLELSITNTFVVPDTKVEMPVEKVWIDDNNKAGKRPQSVKVAVVQNDTVYDTKELSSSNDWKYTFTNLPEYDEEGNKYNYEIIELTSSEYYKSEIDGGKITNTFDPIEKKVNFSIVKNWNDNNNSSKKRPEEIKLELYGSYIEDDTNNGELIQTITISKDDVSETDTNVWKKTTDTINTTYDNFYIKEIINSDLYESTVTIIKPSSAVLEGQESPITTFSTSRIPTMKASCFLSTSLEIDWDDNDNEQNTRPKSVDVSLYYAPTSDETNKKLYGTLRMSEDRVIVLEDPTGLIGKNTYYSSEIDYWHFSGNVIPSYKTYDYWVEISQIPNYDTDYLISYGGCPPEAGTFVFISSILDETPKTYEVSITNNFVVPDTKVEIPTKKIWVDDNNKAGKRPESITIQLKNGETIVEEQVISSANNWSYTFNVPKYDENADEIIYTIDEKTTPKFYSKVISGTTITNTFEIPEEKVNITANKVWIDDNDKASKRPESITIQLKNGETIVQEQVISSANNWSYTFNVPKYDEKADEIIYTIDEKTTPRFYRKSISGTTITNTFYVPEDKTSIEINKIWTDNENKASKRPNSISVEILSNDTTIDVVTINAENNWIGTIDNLPLYDQNANVIEYSIKEQKVDFYTTKILDLTPNNGTFGPILPKTFEIINTFEVPTDKINVTATKVWNDNENFANKRPDSIVLQIKYEDEIIEEKTVGAIDGWSYTFSVPKYDENANERVYKVDEKTTPKFYVKSITGNTITNTFEVPDDLIELTVIKEWKDDNNKAGYRPENITLQVKKDDVVVKERSISATDNWKYTFLVEKYDEKANEITYTVDEKESNKFYKKTISGMTITNTFYVPAETTELTATKVWNDNENKAGKRPDSVILQAKDGNSIVEEIEVSSQNNWTCTFTQLPKYDELGKEIVYKVDEKTTPKFYTKVVNGNVVTNIFQVPEEKKNVTITKVWDDNSDKANKRPDSIILQIINNGTVVEEKEVNAYDDWKYTFSVPKYDENANEITYTADEKELNKFYKKSISGTTITNTFYIPDDKIDITATKIWDDDNNELGKRLDSITFQLKVGKEIVKEQAVSSADNWTYTFKELPKYDENANEIKYTLDEKESSEFYIKTISGYTITNKFVIPEKQKEISGEKIWIDYDNKYQTRPESVTIQIYAKETLVTEYEVSEATNWKFNIKLDLYDEKGNEIEYTLKEKTIEGYDSTINDFIVTNKLQTRKIKTEVVGGEGGTIVGDESVPYGSDSTENNIKIKPKEGYVLEEIRINGEKINIDNKSDEQILEIIRNVREDQLIQVIFTKKTTEDMTIDDNPETSDKKTFIILTILSIGNLILYNYRKNKGLA